MSRRTRAGEARLIAGALALCLSAFPALAQDGAVDPASPTVAADPQREALARGLAAKLLPDGSYQRMMRESMGPMMDQIFDAVGSMSMGQIAALGNLDPEAVAQIGDATLGEMMAIVDPQWRERMRLQNAAMMAAFADLFAEFEPGMRGALATIFARDYGTDELIELDRFFATPLGARYAGNSFGMWTDPAVMESMTSMMPKIMEAMPALMAEVQSSTAGLPPKRSFEDLTPEERERLSDLLGIPEAEIQNNWPDSTI